jgi:hypothetical protein
MNLVEESARGPFQKIGGQPVGTLLIRFRKQRLLLLFLQFGRRRNIEFLDQFAKVFHRLFGRGKDNHLRSRHCDSSRLKPEVLDQFGNFRRTSVFGQYGPQTLHLWWRLVRRSIENRDHIRSHLQVLFTTTYDDRICARISGDRIRGRAAESALEQLASLCRESALPALEELATLPSEAKLTELANLELALTAETAHSSKTELLVALVRYAVKAIETNFANTKPPADADAAGRRLRNRLGRNEIEQRFHYPPNLVRISAREPKYLGLRSFGLRFRRFAFNLPGRRRFARPLACEGVRCGDP